jgi:hypothetical protein
MKTAAKKWTLLPLLLLAGWVMAAPAAAVTIGYPSTDHASFLVDVPSDWEVSPGEEEGDFVDVNSDSGVYLAFRTIEGSEDAMQGAIEDTVAYLQENYKNVTVGDPKDVKQAGLEGFLMDGEGKDEDGTAIVFRAAWLALADGTIGEIWFAAPASDKAGIAAAAKALNSFRVP